MDIEEHLRLAREQARAKAAEQRNAQPFQLTWRGGGSEFVTGWSAVCTRLGLQENTLRVRLSQGKGSHTLLRSNPLTGEPDALTVTRLPLAKGQTKKRGRPASQDHADPRLGTEFAPPAKSVPKRTNLRRDDGGVSHKR